MPEAGTASSLQHVFQTKHKTKDNIKTCDSYIDIPTSQAINLISLLSVKSVVTILARQM
jgi:hypothetical protein